MDALPIVLPPDPTVIASIALLATGFIVGSAFRRVRTERPARKVSATTVMNYDYGSDGDEILRVMTTLREQRINTTCTWRRAGLLLLSPPAARTLAQEMLGPLQIIRVAEVFEWYEPFPYAVDGQMDGMTLQKLLQTLFLEMAKSVRIPPSPTDRRSLETPRKRTRFLDGTKPRSDFSTPSTPVSSASIQFAGHTPGLRSALKQTSACDYNTYYNTSTSSSSSLASLSLRGRVPARIPPPPQVYRPNPGRLTQRSTSTNDSATVREHRAPIAPLSLCRPTSHPSPLKRPFAFFNTDTDEEDSDEEGPNSPLENKGVASLPTTSLSVGVKKKAGTMGPIRTATSAAIFEVFSASNAAYSGRDDESTV